jgi:UDP-N-acetylmuramyl tripeptide synthase
MEDYLLAKLRLFKILEKGNIAVVNADVWSSRG